MDGLQWETLLKGMIWGYHHFRKPQHMKDGNENTYYMAAAKHLP